MKSPVRIVCAVFPLLLLMLSASFVAHAQDDYASMKKWDSFDFASKSITTADMNALEIDDLKLVRGVVFGKHGRVFKDPDIRRFLESRSWFKADSTPRSSSINVAKAGLIRIVWNRWLTTMTPRSAPRTTGVL